MAAQHRLNIRRMQTSNFGIENVFNCENKSICEVKSLLTTEHMNGLNRLKWTVLRWQSVLTVVCLPIYNYIIIVKIK